MQCGEQFLFIWALFLPGNIFSSASHGEFIAQILQSRSFILQPCQHDKTTCVGMNATGFRSLRTNCATSRADWRFCQANTTYGGWGCFGFATVDWLTHVYAFLILFLEKACVKGAAEWYLHPNVSTQNPLSCWGMFSFWKMKFCFYR